MRFPRGIDLIQKGLCPTHSIRGSDCMFCPFGHILECHYPLGCEEAECAHWIESQDDFPEDYGLDPDFTAEDVFGPGDIACWICGCTELRACPGGCSWSREYLERGCAICSSCVWIMKLIDLNMSALRILEAGAFKREVI